MISSTITIKQLLVDEQTFKVAKQLQLLAHKTIIQLNAGLHSTKKMSNNFEFNQFKSYNRGDDLRLVDWKTYGKTKKLYIKQAPKVNNIAVHLIPDCSNSMLYEEEGISKINFTIYIFACLANLVLKQQDELYFFNNKKNLTLKEALQLLTNTAMVNKWTNNKQQYYQSIYQNRKKLIVYCSDLYEYNNEMMKWLKLAAAKKNEVLVFHMSGKKEAGYDFEKATHLKDLETGQITRTSKSLREKAKIYFENKSSSLKNNFIKNGIKYYKISMNETPINALSKFLINRNNNAHAF